MPSKPLVSVICLCHNQKPYVLEALASVRAQTYGRIQLIVVDDASTDGSAAVIYDFLRSEGLANEVRFLALEKHHGATTAFNKGLALAKGKFVIDLAADDVLLPTRVAKGVAALQQAGNTYGVHFSDASIINPASEIIDYHYERLSDGSLKHPVPTGEVYADLLARYFVCTPTMMMRKEVFEMLGGYDESLVFEDFDFWVRSSRVYRYCYSDEVLVYKRRVPGSASTKQYVANSAYLRSTLKVCQKALKLNQNQKEHKALRQRIKYEARQALLSGNLGTVFRFITLYMATYQQNREHAEPRLGALWPVW